MVKDKQSLDSRVKERLISVLVPELATLRTKAEISQGDLANIIGVSRQTYNAVECGLRKLTWNMYLTLILYYDYNQKTHQMIRTLGIFPQELIAKINNSDFNNLLLTLSLPGISQDIIAKLDEQALQSIRTMIMVEYGRCTGLPSDAIIKSFDGVTFQSLPATADNVAIKKAISAIKGRNSDGS